MKLQRIALITPPYHSGVVESAGTWLNLGFVYIAGALRQAGYEVDYYDAMSLWHQWPEIRQRITDFAPDVVATTAFTPSVVDGIELLRQAKAVNPDIVTVIGNVHATFCYEELFSDADTPIDFVVRGEGEITLPALLGCLNSGDDPATVAGIAFHRDGKTHATADAPFVADLDSLATAWDLVEWPIYSYRPKKIPPWPLSLPPADAARTAPSALSNSSGNAPGGQEARKTLSPSLEHLNQQYGVNVAMLADEIPTLDRARWEQILDLLIARQPGVKLLMETRVDDILRDEDIMEKYRLAGIEHIYVGVEAGSQKNLNIFKKGTRVEQSKRAIDIINNADIVSETSFVLGMPDDTPESIAQIVELAIHYNPDMAFFLAIAPWPYADLYPTLKEHVAVKDYRKYNLVEPVLKPIAMSLQDLERELAMAAKTFFMHKFQHLEQLTPWKQQFMTEVFRLLVNNSYLAKQMRELATAGGSMPDAIKNALQKPAAAPPVQTIPPIP